MNNLPGFPTIFHVPAINTAENYGAEEERKPQKMQAKICQVFALENNYKKNQSEHVKMIFSYHSACYFFSGVSA